MRVCRASPPSTNGPCATRSSPGSSRRIPWLARPKAPKAYQTESVKSLDDGQVSRLLAQVRERAAAGDVVGKRDYALLMLFVTTGMRRQEVIGLRGSDLELRKGDLVTRCRVKGRDYVARSVEEPLVREALLDYLRSCARERALSSEHRCGRGTTGRGSRARLLPRTPSPRTSSATPARLASGRFTSTRRGARP